MDELFEAIKAGDAERVGALLDANPELLSASRENVSAIMLAIYYGHAGLARLFTERGRRLTFHEACALGELDEVRAMLDADPTLLDSRSPDGFPAVGLPIFFRHPAVARLLIERGADVRAHAQNRQRVAPVHAAAAVGDLETMTLLLDRGADPNARQDNDFTPLHAAAGDGFPELARLLVTRGADTRLKIDGKTAADVARERGHDGLAAWLDDQ